MSVLTLPSSRWIRLTVKGLIESNRAHINQRMAGVDLSGSGGQVPTLSFISHTFKRQFNIDRKSYPAFMIEDRSQSGKWIATNNIGNYRYRFSLWGLLVWDNQEEAQDLISEYAAGVADILNQRHIPIPGPQGYHMYFNGVMPVDEIEYGEAQQPNLIVHGFQASYVCDVDMSIPDSSPQSPFRPIQP